MKRSRFTEEQIIGVLKKQEAGLNVSDLCRKHGISDATFYKWKTRYGGLEVSEALICGHRFRILAVIDDFSHKNLTLVADTSLSGGRVARELTVLVESYGKPLMIVSDSDTEFTSHAILK
ncbi:transposase [Komagataeibacter intermedius TF2]|uniref:Transposase n=2 Tax=Komagataeibacter intermedius TaxID=66229 RepID=A0A0N1N5S2_9PROT|nr:transposase [Komagataeibacter intermedius AF2]GAN88488.1 transposase [Komagataeibacter intermedius TF2]GBQ74844.1 transposase [Komagataeibacter intermedius NRIC 0521]